MGDTTNVDKANAYGGILLAKDGYVLLREPTNHFDGYMWTFPKGKPEPGEAPDQTAIREVWEETGCKGNVVDVLPGTYASGLSTNAYFVMTLQEQEPAFGWESQTVCWVNFEEAKNLILKSTNTKGRFRDLKVLEAVEAWFDKNSSLILPDFKLQYTRRATALDWRINPFASGYHKVPLDITFSASQSRLIKMGYIPSAMEEKWFAYFDGNTLYQYSSWTGLAVDKVHFVPIDDGLRATHAEVSHDATTWLEERYAYSAQRIEDMLNSLADRITHQPTSSPFVASIQQLNSQYYLGSTDAVDRLLIPYLDAIMKIWVGIDAYKERNKYRAVIEKAMSGEDSDYLLIDGWHTRKHLGNALISSFNLDAGYCKDESLMFVVSEAMAALSNVLHDYRDIWIESRDTPEEETVDDALATIFKFTRCVFMGTHSVYFSGLTLNDLAALHLKNTDDGTGQSEIEISPPVNEQSQPTEMIEHPLPEFDRLLKELNALQRLPAFTFEAVGIRPDTILRFTLCPDIICVVKDNKKVMFQGQVISLSQAALLAMTSIGKQRKAARGPDYWLYEGITLTQLREQLSK